MVGLSLAAAIGGLDLDVAVIEPVAPDADEQPSFDSRTTALSNGSRRVLEVFFDIFNITNRANFDNPVVANRDMRLPGTFLVLTNLYGGSGFPRQAQLGMRFEF